MGELPRGSRRPRRGKARWPRFVQVAGPELTGRQMHWATVSDRDPVTGRSGWAELEGRNRAMRAPRQIDLGGPKEEARDG